MEKITVTAKIQISVTPADRDLLDRTMSAYRDACNYVSDYVFRTHDMNRFSLNRELYRGLRDRFGLGSQMAQSVLKTVVSRYKTILTNQEEWIQPSFKLPQCDLVWNRDYSLHTDVFSVNTLQGRVKLPYFQSGMEQYFDHSVYRFGTARLVSKHGKYFLHIPVTRIVDSYSPEDTVNIVGIDRGINFAVTTYDSCGKTGYVNGRVLKQKRAHYKKLRSQLQKRHTPSARRRLLSIGQRENRWMQDVNHCISKALVTSNPENTLFVLEDLSGVRGATERVKTKDRYVSVSWSFYDLELKLFYKSVLNHQHVIKVDPRYTSQRCPLCGHTEKANRCKKMHLFTCKKCGYRSNDDRIGAMNLYSMGKDWLNAVKVPGTVMAG